MDEEISIHKAQDQLARLLAKKALIAYHGWEMKLEALYLYVLIYPKRQATLKFMARFHHDGYPQRAPAFTFVDPQTGQEGKQYWPQKGPSFQTALSRNPPQLCIAGIREFHEILHKERLWDARKYPLPIVLQDIQIELDKAYV